MEKQSDDSVTLELSIASIHCAPSMTPDELESAWLSWCVTDALYQFPDGL